MLRFLFVLLCLTGTSSQLSACDACGCGVGSGGFGLLGIYRSNAFGLQYGYSGFRSFYTSGEPTGTEDAFHSTGLFLRYSPLNRLRLSVSQNYHSNRRSGPAGDQQLDGWGDLQIGVTYVLLQDLKLGSSSTLYLEAGGGLSLPTGRFVTDPLEDYFLPDNFSPGRGALAYTPSFLVAINGNQLGVSLNGEGKWHHRTEDDYRFGTEMRLAGQVFSQLKLGASSSWIPYTGLQYERTSANQSRNGNPVHATGGEALLAKAGIQFRFIEFAGGFSFTAPLSTDYASGEVGGKMRVSAEVFYQF